MGDDATGAFETCSLCTCSCMCRQPCHPLLWMSRAKARACHRPHCFSLRQVAHSLHERVWSCGKKRIACQYERLRRRPCCSRPWPMRRTSRPNSLTTCIDMQTRTGMQIHSWASLMHSESSGHPSVQGSQGESPPTGCWHQDSDGGFWGVGQGGYSCVGQHFQRRFSKRRAPAILEQSLRQKVPLH